MGHRRGRVFGGVALGDPGSLGSAGPGPLLQPLGPASPRIQVCSGSELVGTVLKWKGMWTVGVRPSGTPLLGAQSPTLFQDVT